MLEANLFELFIKPLNDSEIEYMTTGSVAAMLYGRPRMTHDIDLVIRLSDSQVVLLERIYPAGLFYCPPMDAIRMEIGRETRGHFSVIHLQTGFKADFYPVGKDEMMGWGLQHRQRMKLDALGMQVAPPEYVIIQKLRYFQEGHSSKHLMDIQAMLKVCPQQIDQQRLLNYIKHFALEKEWLLAQNQ